MRMAILPHLLQPEPHFPKIYEPFSNFWHCSNLGVASKCTSAGIFKSHGSSKMLFVKTVVVPELGHRGRGAVIPLSQ